MSKLNPALVIVSASMVGLLTLAAMGTYKHVYTNGYDAGYAAERPIEREIRQFQCVPRSDVPFGQLMMRAEGISIVIVRNQSTNEAFPVKVCDQPEVTEI